MAKKISIEFTGQPITTGPGFSYNVSISGFDLYYSNGYSELKVEFLANGNSPVNYYDLPIGLTLEETLQITLSFLRENYFNDLVTYSLVDSAIEVRIEGDATVIVSNLLNANIDITVTEIEPDVQNLKYYLIFDDYTLNIYKSNYLGSASEIFGTFTLKKSSVDTILTPIRGTGLDLALEASQTLTFDEFLLEDEFTYKTELLKGSQTIFEGYIKPDGCQQSYVNDAWMVNIESVDGLGLLKDLSFVRANGLRFTGKLSVYDVIKGCLDRTKLSMVINTSTNVEYVDYAGSNILKDVFVRSDRFIKDKDDSVLMDCNEVLKSMLNLFSAVITQQEGQWWIYRPNDLILNGYTTFINQDTDTTFVKNLNAVLGSQINNFYPHHCEGNQQIEVKGAISAYRLNYQYGFLDGFILNPNLNHDASLVYNNWTVNPTLGANILLNNPSDSSGVIMKPGGSIFSIAEVITSDVFEAFQGDILTFKATAQTTWIKNVFYFKIKTSDGYFLNDNNEWELGSGGFGETFTHFTCGANLNPSIITAGFELLMPPILNDCDLSVVICRPIPDVGIVNGLSEVTSVQITDQTIKRQGIVGEFHTVSRRLPPSSITKENQKVFNGDGAEILIGSIYKDDLETRTNLWSRKNKFENLPLLGISAMDDLRIQSSPIKSFSGSIFGEIPYMSVITIDNVNGLFMPIEYNYNPKTNKSDSIKLLEFYNSDLGDIEYIISPDYGNSTIKPTIKG